MVAEGRPQATSRGDTLKLIKLANTDDIEAYLAMLEYLMQAYEVDEACWALKLAPQLTGKPQQAYAAMDPTSSTDYDQ